MTSSSFVSPLDCLTSFLGISLSRAVSSFGRITNVSKSAITAETYIRSWRKPPEIPEVCRMARWVCSDFLPVVTRAMSKGCALVNVQEWGCFSIYRRADDVTRPMSKGVVVVGLLVNVFTSLQEILYPRLIYYPLRAKYKSLTRNCSVRAGRIPLLQRK